MAHHRVLVLLALAVALVATACGDDDPVDAAGGTTTTALRTIEPGTFEPATEGTMLRWYEAAGECPDCAFSITFDASGTATYEGADATATVTFDVDELASRMEAVDGPPLTEGTDDCGREVDGNAPVLELSRSDGTVLEIDDCYRPIDREHPIMVFVYGVLDEAEAAAVSG